MKKHPKHIKDDAKTRLIIALISLITALINLLTAILKMLEK